VKPTAGEGVEARLARTAVAFGRALRAAGLEAPVSSVAGFAEAVALVGLERPDSVFWAGSAIFVRRPEDAMVYAGTFSAFFGGGVPEIPA
jgi:uncharacterized protein with von Willebrand factor type A (vWA) domain